MSVEGNTLGGPNAFASYDNDDPLTCDTTLASGGSEVYYRFESPVEGPVTVNMTPRLGDLDLIITGSATDGGCDPTGQCLALSQTTGSGQESITFDAVRGQTYYLIVDAPSGSYSYDLDLTCQMGPI